MFCLTKLRRSCEAAKIARAYSAGQHKNNRSAGTSAATDGRDGGGAARPVFLHPKGGEDIAGAFILAQFRSEIERQAHNAPAIMRRDSASLVSEEMTATQF
jgi:hypothetical protein